MSQNVRVSMAKGMGTKKKSDPGGARGGKHLPEFALKIREMREKCNLTQPSFGAELGTTRGGVAKWEAADREPGADSYRALALFARRRSLTDYEKFFSARVWEAVRDLEHKLDEADARRFYLAIGQSVDWGALARFSKAGMGRRDFIKQQAERVVEAHRTLTNGELEKAFLDIVSETFYSEQLSKPGALEAYRRLTRLQRDIADFRSADPSLPEEARHGIVRRILDGWGLAVLEGKIPDSNKLDEKLSENKLFEAMLAKISGIIAVKWSSEREGTSYSDMDFMKDLERALGGLESPKEKKI